jgi:hypothetical protein
MSEVVVSDLTTHLALSNKSVNVGREISEYGFIHKGFKGGVINIDYIDINVESPGIVSFSLYKLGNILQ